MELEGRDGIRRGLTYLKWRSRLTVSMNCACIGLMVMVNSLTALTVYRARGEKRCGVRREGAYFPGSVGLDCVKVVGVDCAQDLQLSLLQLEIGSHQQDRMFTRSEF